MAKPAGGPLEDEMQDSITLSTGQHLEPCPTYFEAEIPASPTYSISSMSTLSSISDLDLELDSESLLQSLKVESEVASSTPDVLENTENVIEPSRKIYQKSRARGVDVCADAGTVEAFRVARAIAAAEDSDFSITGQRQLRSSNKLNYTKKTLFNSSNEDSLEISSKRVRLSNNAGIGTKTQLEASSVAIEQEYEHDQREHLSLDTTTYLSPNKSTSKKQKVNLTHRPAHQPNHEISLETPAPRKKGVRKKRPPRWSWVEITDDKSLELNVEQERLSQEPAKRHASLPLDYRNQEFSFRADFPFNSDKKSIRQSRALSEGADEPRNPTPVVPTIIRKSGILADATITPGRLRPRKEPSTLSPYKPRKPTSGSVVPKKRLMENGGEINIAGSFQVRPLADITNKFHVEPGDGEKSAKMTIGSDHGSEKLTPKRQKLNCGSKSIQNCGDQTSSSSIAVIETLPDVLTIENGVYKIPKICHGCLRARRFCDRKAPCDRCSKSGVQCTRDEGLVSATKHFKPKIEQTEDEYEPFSISPAPDPSLSQKKQTRPTGKPPSLNNALQLSNGIENSIAPKVKRTRVKREVMNRLPAENASQGISVIPYDPQANKPPGIKKPDIWCESRQELCESLTYFRSYQGGCYGHNGLILGSLLDGFASPRDYLDGKVAITHTGGKSGNDEDGQRRLLTSQTIEDQRIRNLLNNVRDKSPLVLIIGQSCAHSPSKIPHTYCVMDWFKVTVGWAEKDTATGFVRWKFRFEKLDSSTDGWWASKPSVESEHPEEMVMGVCDTCSHRSPHVYTAGWMCHYQECPQFWKIDGNDPPTELEYTHNFIHCRTPWPQESSKPPSDLRPTLDEKRDIYYNGEDVSRICWKGMCCPKCGRLNCRELWAGWRCLSCGYTNSPPRTIFTAAGLADPHRPIFTGPAVPTNNCHQDVIYKRFVVDGMTVMQYVFGDCGTVTHILANKNTNARPQDADWLLENYQSIEMPFKRFPLQNHKSKGTLLTQQFSFNCGAPYKFIAKVDSNPFDKSPPVVSQALNIVTTRAKLIHADAEFNEILSVGYFEGQKMDFHDDGEAGLGETVASISLGAPARMKFRLKKKYAKDSHLWTAKPSALLKADNSNMDDEEDEEENEDLSGVQQKPTRVAKDTRVKLDLCLNHGDVMIMSGPGIQKYWEHSVIPVGKFRIAATARFIHPNHAGVREQIRDMNSASVVNASSDSPPLHPQPSADIQQVSVPNEHSHEHIDGKDNAADGIPLHPKLPSQNIQQTFASNENRHIEDENNAAAGAVNDDPNAQQASVPNGFNSGAYDRIDLAATNPNTPHEQAREFPKFPTTNIFHPVDIPIQMVNNTFYTSPE